MSSQPKPLQKPAPAPPTAQTHQPTAAKPPIPSFDLMPDGAFIREAQLVQSIKRPTTPGKDAPEDKQQALAAILQAHPGNTCSVQCQRIRAALSRFSLTTFEAMRYLDIYDPRARVARLRKTGECIDTHWVQRPTESGRLHRIGCYVMGIRQ